MSSLVAPAYVAYPMYLLFQTVLIQKLVIGKPFKLGVITNINN